MAQNVLRYNDVIVGKFFNKGSWVSEAWRKAHPEEFEEEAEGKLERVTTAAERREQLYLDQGPVSVVCVRPSGTPPPHDARLTSAGRGQPHLVFFIFCFQIETDSNLFNHHNSKI